MMPTRETCNTTTVRLAPRVDAVSASTSIIDPSRSVIKLQRLVPAASDGLGGTYVTRFALRVRDGLLATARLLLLFGLMLPTFSLAATFTPTVFTDLAIGSLAK